MSSLVEKDVVYMKICQSLNQTSELIQAKKNQKESFLSEQYHKYQYDCLLQHCDGLCKEFQSAMMDANKEIKTIEETHRTQIDKLVSDMNNLKKDIKERENVISVQAKEMKCKEIQVTTEIIKPMPDDRLNAPVKKKELPNHSDRLLSSAMQIENEELKLQLKVSQENQVKIQNQFSDEMKNSHLRELDFKQRINKLKEENKMLDQKVRTEGLLRDEIEQSMKVLNSQISEKDKNVVELTALREQMEKDLALVNYQLQDKSNMTKVLYNQVKGVENIITERDVLKSKCDKLLREQEGLQRNLRLVKQRKKIVKEKLKKLADGEVGECSDILKLSEEMELLRHEKEALHQKLNDQDSLARENETLRKEKSRLSKTIEKWKKKFMDREAEYLMKQQQEEKKMREVVEQLDKAKKEKLKLQEEFLDLQSSEKIWKSMEDDENVESESGKASCCDGYSEGDFESDDSTKSNSSVNESIDQSLSGNISESSGDHSNSITSSDECASSDNTASLDDVTYESEEEEGEMCEESIASNVSDCSTKSGIFFGQEISMSIPLSERVEKVEPSKSMTEEESFNRECKIAEDDISIEKDCGMTCDQDEKPDMNQIEEMSNKTEQFQPPSITSISNQKRVKKQKRLTSAAEMFGPPIKQNKNINKPNSKQTQNIRLTQDSMSPSLKSTNTSLAGAPSLATDKHPPTKTSKQENTFPSLLGAPSLVTKTSSPAKKCDKR